MRRASRTLQGERAYRAALAMNGVLPNAFDQPRPPRPSLGVIGTRRLIMRTREGEAITMQQPVGRIHRSSAGVVGAKHMVSIGPPPLEACDRRLWIEDPRFGRRIESAPSAPSKHV